MSYSPIEIEKISFLEENFETPQKGNSKQLTINLQGVLIECQLFGVEEKDYNYLKDYYRPFFQREQKIERKFSVIYHVFQDDRKTLKHPWYGERYPNIHFLKSRDETATFIIERDYCAFTKDQLSTTTVYGPSPGHDNPDSLDNLFATIFASCNKLHRALLLHSCAIVKDEKAWVFFGISGAGKSTLAFHAYNTFHQKVISSDQTLLRIEEDKIIAQSTPITIPELDRNSPLRTWDSYEVAGIIHLTQEGEVGFRKLSSLDFFKLFIGQSSFYLTPFSDQQAYMNLCQEILEKNILKGEIKYFRDSDFWTLIPG